MFKLMAKPVNHAFVLNPEKADEFINRKANPEIKNKIISRAEKLKLQRESFKNK